MKAKTRELFLQYTDPKYELIEEYNNGDLLFRVRALRDFADVRAGDTGGFVHGHQNLSHDGNAWIYDDAAALDNSHVGDDAKLFGNSELRHSSRAMGDARLYRSVQLNDSAQALDDVRLSGNITMSGASIASGFASLSGDITTAEMTHFTGSARLEAHDGWLHIRDFVIIRDNAHVVGGPNLDWLRGNLIIGGDASIRSEYDLERVANLNTSSKVAPQI